VADTAAIPFDLLEQLTQIGGNPLRRVAEGFGQIADRQRAIKEAATPQRSGNLMAGIDAGFESGGQNLKYAPLAFLGPAGIMAALTGMVAEQGGTTYSQDRSKGIAQGPATVHAAGDMLAEYVGERYFGAAGFLERLAAGKPFSKLMVYEVTREIPGEIGTTLWQNFNDWAITNPDKSVKDFLSEQPDAIAQTAIATFVGGGVQAGAGRMAVRTAEAVLNRQMGAVEAAQRAEAFQRAMELVNQSKLAERSPEVLASVINEMAGDSPLRFDARALSDVFAQSGLTPEQLQQALPSVQAQLAEAVQTGGEVAIPAGEFIAGVRGTPLEQSLVQHARLGDAQMSQIEAKQAMDQAQDFIRQEAERVLAEAQNQGEWQQSAESVKATIVEQLNAAGRFSPQVNEAYGTLVRDFFSVMAQRQGMTPQELYQRYPLRVGAVQQPGAVLNSGGVTVGMKSDTQFLSAKSPAGQVGGHVRDGALHIIHAEVADGERGKGKGLELYSALVDKALADGLNVFSDSTVEAAAARVYEALKRRGYDVRRLDGGQLEDGALYGKGAKQPVFEIVAGPQVLRQSPIGLAIKELTTVTDTFAEFGMDLQVAETQADLPASGQKRIKSEGLTGVRGMYDPDTDKAWIVRQNVGSVEEAFFVGMHEAFHRGLARSFGEEINPILEFIEEHNDSVREKAAQYREQHGMDRHEAIEEVLADMSGEGIAADLTGWDKLLQFLTDAISKVAGKLGVNIQLTDEMVQQFVAGVRKIGVPEVYVDASPDAASDVAATLLELGKYLDLFKYPKSDSTDIAEIARAKDLSVRPVDPNATDSTEWMLSNSAPDGATSWLVSTPDGRLGTVTHRGSEVWVNVSAVGEGGGGSAIYDLAANYAVNNGLVFIGDPLGVSEAALRRRLENMLSSAIKYGTTDHLAPHPDQLAGKPESGISPLQWTPGDTLGNIKAMVEASLATTQAAAPFATSEVTYDAASRQFQQPDGARLEPADIAGLLDFEAEVRRPGAPGNATVQRAALFHSLLQGPDERRAILDAVRSQQSAAGAGLGGTFYQVGARATFNPETFLIGLGENADLTSFIHESGHFFLEVMADLASQPNAPAEIVEDMNRLLKWFGVADAAAWNALTLEQKRPYHEKTAESFEQYIFEGKAPNQELQPLFRRFRSWMVSVYKSLKDFMRGRDLQLNDEVRQVFDRMLATDEQIREAEEAAGMFPDFDATNEAIEKLQARSLRDLKWTVNARSKKLKALQKQAAGFRKEIGAEVRAEVQDQPEARAAKALDALRKSKRRDPSEVEVAALADSYGYESVDALLHAIDTFGPVQDAIDRLTDRRMLEVHGDLATPEAIEAAANEAVHNEARARALATELRTQAEALNPRLQTGTDRGGRPITVNALVDAARQFAQNLAARRRLKELTSAAQQHRQAEARASKRWREATAAGNTEEAVAAKRDQLLNAQTVKALLEAREESKRILEFFATVTKGTNEKLVKRVRDPDVVNAARAILAAYDIAPRLEEGAHAYLEKVQQHDPTMYEALRPAMEGALRRAKPVDQLTMEELRTLKDEIDSMWYMAKRSRQMEVDGDLIDVEEAAQELAGRMEAIGIPAEVPGERGAITAAESAKRSLQFAGALLRRVEQWAEAKDGKHGGPFLRLVFQPVKAAADRYRTDRLAYRKKFTALVEQVAPAMKPGTIKAPELGYTFGEGHNGIGQAELLHAILHTGNDSNKRKLLLGRQWAVERPDGSLDTSRWDGFERRMQDTGVLTKAHYDFAQGVWDLLDAMKPLAQKTHRDVFGHYFDEVTATSFTTPFGAYRGGYVPAQADPRIVNDAALRKLTEQENENMAFSFPATNRGFTKGRVEYNRPLMLDIRSLTQHIDKVLLFSHMEPAVRDINRLLLSKAVSNNLTRIDPAAYEGMLIPWLNRAARQQVETPIVGDGGASRLLSALRARAGMALMFGNISNTIQQVTGLSNAAVKVKPAHLMRATSQYIAQPKQTAQAVAEASPYMADRIESEIAAVTDAMDQILLNASLYEKAQKWTTRHTYFLQSALDNVFSPIVWTGAYNQALAEGRADAEAVKFADGVVRQTQGSTLPEDVSRMETGPAYARMFTQFYGYFNMLANTNATALQQVAQEVGLKKGAGKALGILFFGLLAPAWVAEAIAVAFRGGPDDEDRDGYLDDWLAQVIGMGTLKNMLAYVPFVGQTVNAGINRFNHNPTDDRISVSPAVSLLESGASAPHSVYKAISDNGSKARAVKDVASAVSIALGLPAYALARPVSYITGVADDRIEPTGPVDAVRGTVTGTASKESRRP
jgi:hypothetical protein